MSLSLPLATYPAQQNALSEGLEESAKLRLVTLQLDDGGHVVQAPVLVSVQFQGQGRPLEKHLVVPMVDSVVLSPLLFRVERVDAETVPREPEEELRFAPSEELVSPVLESALEDDFHPFEEWVSDSPLSEEQHLLVKLLAVPPRYRDVAVKREHDVDFHGHFGSLLEPLEYEPLLDLSVRSLPQRANASLH